MEKKYKILLIDDEPDNLETLSLLLSAEGYTTVEAADGYQGLEKLADGKYDLVICDYFMPKLDGINMLAEMRHRKDYTPVIFFSGNANEKHAVKILGLGAYEVVNKPNLDRLVKAVKKTLTNTENIKLMDKNSTPDSDEFLEILHSAK